MELTPYEIIALMRHHLGLLDPSPDRMIALANELKAARARDQKASAIEKVQSPVY
jgi:hypothetical protein